MKIPCLEMEQNGRVLYLGSLFAKDVANLINNGKMKKDEWEPDHPDGYQRGWNEARSGAFAVYLIRDKGISPSTLFLNVRDEKPLIFNRVEGAYGFLDIPDETVLWEIDGQHRAEGLRLAVIDDPKLGNFMVPVVIARTKTTYEEAEQFYIINQTQKRMRTDLAERFIKREAEEKGLHTLALKGKDWLVKAIDIVDTINTTTGTWYNKIQLPNQSKGGTLVSQQAFTDSLEPILKHHLFEDYNAEELTEMLNIYWNGTKQIFPEAFYDPKSYLIQKTTGAFVLHRLLPDVISLCVGPDGRIKLSEEKIGDILKRTGCFNPAFWERTDSTTSQYGTNQKAFRALYLLIKEKLPSSAEAVRTKRLIDISEHANELKQEIPLVDPKDVL